MSLPLCIRSLRETKGTDRLCLNPKTIDGIKIEKKKTSTLAAALSGLE